MAKKRRLEIERNANSGWFYVSNKLYLDPCVNLREEGMRAVFGSLLGLRPGQTKRVIVTVEEDDGED